MTPEELKKLETVLVSLIPDGKMVTNNMLQEKFLKAAQKEVSNVNADAYWEVRNQLIDAGVLVKGRGRGGTIYRALPATTLSAEAPKASEPGVDAQFPEGERELYLPFYKTIADFWVKDNAIKEYIIELTAQQGRRTTGGRWTRPDVTLIAVGNYQFIPGKIIEITSFELKATDNFDITGVFEAAAHSAFAHKSYLAIQVSNSAQQNPDLERVRSECRRFGVGLISFGKPSDWQTFEVQVEPDRREPDPRIIDEFITKQISSENQRQLLQHLK